MIHRICATLAIATVYFLFCMQSIPESAAADGTPIRTGAHAIGRQYFRKDVTPTEILIESTVRSTEISKAVSAAVAQYSESDRSWTFAAKVLQLEDVSIYGKPGTIGRIEYVREGQPEYAWVVIKIDDYYFSENTTSIFEGKTIMLEVSGEHVSPQGVNWDACSSDDLYCGYARFVEGGFPTSEDYNGLTICPSNSLIYSGYASDDWINGMLAWKITIRG